MEVTWTTLEVIILFVMTACGAVVGYVQGRHDELRSTVAWMKDITMMSNHEVEEAEREYQADRQGRT